MNIARRAFVPAAGAIALTGALGFGAAFATQESDPDATAAATQATQQEAEGEGQDELGPMERRQERLDDFLNRVAEELGVERSALDDAMVAARLAQLDDAVDLGIIGEERAAEIRERIESGEVPGLFGPGPRHHHPGKFRGGPGPFDGDHPPFDGPEDSDSSSDDSEASIEL
ncbi:MAG: hypothetical protein U5Q44_10860 [Dehalococcoidia bacterium]|nr:hypothetical protein [Dehalococcoidia bacterium]